jgi:hypothetical protein
MIGTVAKAVMLAVLAVPVLSGQTTNGPGAACGDAAVTFKVETASGIAPAGAPVGKALLVFIQKDAGDSLASTTMAGMDGQWMGATHGNSWFSFAIDPGVHHLCALTHFSGWMGGGSEAALLHFTAQTGKVYYFEAKNFAFSAERQTDVSLTAVDADEGAYLVSREPLSSAHRKK